MESQNNTLGRSFGDRLVWWFLEANRNLPRKSYTKKTSTRQVKSRVVSIDIGVVKRIEEDGRNLPAQYHLPSLHSSLPQAPTGSHHSISQTRKSEAPEKQRGSLKPQSEAAAELGLKARLRLPCNTHTHVQLSGTACLHSHVTARIWRNTSSAAPGTSQESLRNGNNWLFHLRTRACSLIPSPCPQPCWPQGWGQRSRARWKLGP